MNNQSNGVNHNHQNGGDFSNNNTLTKVTNENSTVYYNKQELVRLLIQSLQNLGYSNSADALEKESGILLQSKEISQFSKFILGGEWSKIDSLIPHLNLKSKEDLDNVKFLIYSQKYLELIEKKNIKDALVCLRNEITPLSKDPIKLQTLTTLIMCPSPQQLESKKKELSESSTKDIESIGSRIDLLNNIKKYVSSDILLPENRLEELIKESIQYQIGKCLFHNSSETYISLFKDHACSKDQMPLEARFTLKDRHRDEVWYIKFSHNGKRLASCSKDATIVIWDMSGVYDSVPTEPKPILTMHGHSKEISYLSWSPNDKYLLSASNDHLVKLWNMDGVCLKTYSKHSDCVTAVVWHPDGKRFLSGGNDKNVHLWYTGIPEIENNNNNSNNLNNSSPTISKDPVKTWTIARVNDLAVQSDGKKFIVICQEKKIRIYDLDGSTMNNDGSPISIPETEAITSMELSKDNRYLLINISNQEIHLWDLEKRVIVQKYRGQKQGRYVIRSCFGGLDESFVLSGSEDSLIYIWHRQSGALLETLSGHQGTVNSVVWSPISPYLFCSASDDCTIKVWTRPLDKLMENYKSNPSSGSNSANSSLNTTPSKNNKRLHE